MIGALSTQDLISIAAAGGGIDFDAAGVRRAIFVAIAAAAGGRAKIVLRGMAGRSVADLIAIGAAGKASVVVLD
jgi:hypothetical protein